jgi:hypothetical protein
VDHRRDVVQQSTCPPYQMRRAEREVLRNRAALDNPGPVRRAARKSPSHFGHCEGHGAYSSTLR